jgi:hypothetical protein
LKGINIVGLTLSCNATYDENVEFPFYLRTKTNKFSTFGVLCDIVANKTLYTYYNWKDCDDNHYYCAELCIYLPEGIKKEVQLKNREISTIDKMMIDGLRFADISDWIEECIRGE